MVEYGKPPEDYGLKVRVVEVTPEIAETWLAKNLENRNTKPTAIEKYTRDMEAGAWLLTGEPIKFDWNGVLRDGQNRLHACMASKCSFTSLVIFDIDPDTFPAMDRGLSRTLVDVLKIRGVPDASKKVAVLHYMWREANYKTLRAGGKRVMTAHEAEVMLEQHPEVIEALDWYGPLAKAFVQPAALGPYLWWRFSRINRGKADVFFRQLAFGENLRVGDAVMSLRELLKDAALSKGRRSDFDQDYMRTLVFSAWRFWNANKQATPRQLQKAADKLAQELRTGATQIVGEPHVA